MNRPFELQTDLQNQNLRYGIYDKNKLSNLHNNSLFWKRYILSSVIVIGSYK